LTPTPHSLPHIMSKLHDEKYKKWDALASSLDEQATLEDDADKKAAAEALGHTTQPWSEAEAKEKEKRERAALAKKALDKQREMEEAGKLYVTGTLPPKIDASYMDGKRILHLKDCTSGSCVVSLPTPLIKVFMTSCSGVDVTFDVNVLTSHLEVHGCSGTTVRVARKISTLQLDACKGLSVALEAGTFSGPDDRVYAAGSSFALSYEGMTVDHDYLKDGAVAVADAPPEEYQFVTWHDAASSSLKTEGLMRLGSKFTTAGAVKGSEEVVGEAMKADKLKEAAAHKTEGGEAFSEGSYAQAVLCYTQALSKVGAYMEGNESLYATLLSNRAACFLKLGHHEKALADAAECVERDPDNVKGWFRKGMSLHAMGKWREALEALGKARDMEGGKNKQVEQAIRFCEMRMEREMRARMS